MVSFIGLILWTCVLQVFAVSEGKDDQSVRDHGRTMSWCHSCPKELCHDPQPDPACAITSSAVPFLRAYSLGLHDHFYTTDAGEMANAVANSGYQQEVSPGKVFATAQPDTIPVYRLYKLHQGLADHWYTVSAPERDNAVAAMGYTYEKIAGYIFPDQRCGSVPLIRTYNVEFGDHFYTSSEADVGVAIANSGYTREGILGFMPIA